MQPTKLRCAALLSCVMLLSACAQLRSIGDSANSSPPHLEKRGQVTQLIVDGKPYLALAGELRNSSSSSLDYMEPIWPKLVKMRLNTVLAVVSWEQVEPVEGQFDFSVVDGLIRDARRHDLRLVLLWFGSWKNGTSRYVAPWVKADQDRFPRVVNKDGKTLEILSTFSEANAQADARAYAALMHRVAQIDSGRHTVIMMQMQNEVGVLGDSRDRCAAANEAFAGPVPAELLEKARTTRASTMLKTSGTWEEVFGKGPATDEIFMAWHYARYCDRISEAGKQQFPLPTFINTWIIQPEDKGPGDYPSGGAIDHLHDIWRAGAPHIDMLCPDIYLQPFDAILARYSRDGNPVFIPESRAGAIGAANAFYAVSHAAIGYSPFAIEEREVDPENGPLSKAYDVLAQLSPLILEYQSKGTISGVTLNAQNPAQSVDLGDFRLNVEFRKTRRTTVLPELGYALIIMLGPDEYLLAGTDVQVTFSPLTDGPPIAGLSRVEEGKFVNGQWVAGRLLNGDEVQLRYDLSAAAAENQSGAGIRLVAGGPTIQRVKLYRYR